MLLLIVGSLGVARWWSRAHQPTWHGKTVEQLFADFRVARTMHRTNFVIQQQTLSMEDLGAVFNDPAAEGLRALGPYAVRWLGNEARGDGFWQKRYRQLFPKLPATLRLKLPAPAARLAIQVDAMMALAAIGSNAAPAMPQVAKALSAMPDISAFSFLTPLQHLPLKPGDLDPALEQWANSRSSSGWDIWFVDMLHMKTAAAARVLTNALCIRLASTNRSSGGSAFVRGYTGTDDQIFSVLSTGFEEHADIIVPALMRALLDGKDEVRLQAVRVFGRFKNGHRAIPMVLQGARSDKQPAALACIRALKVLPVQAGDLNALLADLTAQHKDFLAANLVSELVMRTPQAIQVITNSIFSTDKHEQFVATAELHRMRSHAAWVLPSVITMLKQPDRGMRSDAIHILKGFGTEAAPALPELVEALKSDDSNFRYDVIAALESLGTNALPALPALQAAAQSEDPLVRNAANRAIASLGIPIEIPSPMR